MRERAESTRVLLAHWNEAGTVAVQPASASNPFLSAKPPVKLKSLKGMGYWITAHADPQPTQSAIPKCCPYAAPFSTSLSAHLMSSVFIAGYNCCSHCLMHHCVPESTAADPNKSNIAPHPWIEISYITLCSSTQRQSNFPPSPKCHHETAIKVNEPTTAASQIPTFQTFPKPLLLNPPLNLTTTLYSSVKLCSCCHVVSWPPTTAVHSHCSLESMNTCCGILITIPCPHPLLHSPHSWIHCRILESTTVFPNLLLYPICYATAASPNSMLHSQIHCCGPKSIVVFPNPLSCSLLYSRSTTAFLNLRFPWGTCSFFHSHFSFKNYENQQMPHFPMTTHHSHYRIQPSHKSLLLNPPM